MIRARDIDLVEDPRFLRRSWTAERVGWGALAAFLAAGLLGLLGPGLLSGRTAEGDVRVEYDRFERVQSPSEVRIALAPRARNLWVEHRWMEEVEVENIRPQPVRTSRHGEWVVYSFDSTEDVDVRLGVRFLQAGGAKGRFGTAPERSVEVEQFVYP
jgi:hypothetical protein